MHKKCKKERDAMSQSQRSFAILLSKLAVPSQMVPHMNNRSSDAKGERGDSSPATRYSSSNIKMSYIKPLKIQLSKNSHQMHTIGSDRSPLRWFVVNEY
jgi:hypothetical protein